MEMDSNKQTQNDWCNDQETDVSALKPGEKEEILAEIQRSRDVDQNKKSSSASHGHQVASEVTDSLEDIMKRLDDNPIQSIQFDDNYDEQWNGNSAEIDVKGSKSPHDFTAERFSGIKELEEAVDNILMQSEQMKKGEGSLNETIKTFVDLHIAKDVASVVDNLITDVENQCGKFQKDYFLLHQLHTLKELDTVIEDLINNGENTFYWPNPNHRKSDDAGMNSNGMCNSDEQILPDVKDVMEQLLKIIEKSVPESVHKEETSGAEILDDAAKSVEELLKDVDKIVSEPMASLEEGVQEGESSVSAESCAMSEPPPGKPKKKRLKNFFKSLNCMKKEEDD